MRELDPKYLGVNSFGQTSKRAAIFPISFEALEVWMKMGFEEGFRITSDAPADLLVLGVEAFYNPPPAPHTFEVFAVSSDFDPVDGDIPIRSLIFHKERIND